MKRYRLHTMYCCLLCAASAALFSACGGDDEEEKKVIDNAYRPVQVTPVSGLRIAWDYSSMKQLAALGASPKMVRTADRLVAVYALDNNVYMTASINDGLTWSSPVTLFAKGTHTGKNGTANLTYNDLAGQPAMIRLRDGGMMAACAVRYQYTLNNVSTEFPAAVRVRRINDDLSLGPVTDVYANLGVENPSFLQLPNGRLQLYFVNGPVSQSVAMLSSTAMAVDIKERHVVLIESQDGGLTWSGSIRDFGPDGVDRSWAGAKAVAARAYKDNTWPAPAVAGNDIVVALADNRTVTHKPYTVRSPLAANWTSAVNGDTPDREYALYEILPDQYTMSVPGLLALPSGQTLLSYETDEGRSAGFEAMEVAIGNPAAYNFKYRTRPFPFGDAEKSVGNSLMLFDDHTVLALTSTNRGTAAGKGTAPWYIRGRLLNDLTVSGSQIDHYPVFVGGRSEAGASAGLGIDATNLYVGVRVKDGTPVSAATGTQQGDGVYLYIDAAGLALLDVDAGIYKFWVSSTGEVSRWDGKEGKWTEAPAGGVAVTAGVLADGYALNVVIPRSKLTGFNSRGIRFALGLTDHTGPDTGTTELLSLCRDLSSGTWLAVTFAE